MKKPIIFKSEREIPKGVNVLDTSRSALGELFFVRNPQLPKDSPESKKEMDKFVDNLCNDLFYVYYPWKKIVVIIPNEDIYLELRTARNRNIIETTEQMKFRNLRVGIAGLSVGSAIVSAMTMSGGPKRIKIADFDILEITNLNRIKGTLLDVKSNKVEVIAKSVWELDPFAELELFENGVNDENIEKFITKPKLDILIDEMDSLHMKFRSREIAKKARMPVLMATDTGDGVFLDVERFDLEPDRPIFHGLLNDVDTSNLANLSRNEWMEVVNKIIDPKLLQSSMQKSLPEIGKTLSGIPQLGASAAIAGSYMTYSARQIANGAELASGRYILNLGTIEPN